MAYIGESSVNADCGCRFKIIINLDTRPLGLIPVHPPPILKFDPSIEVVYCKAHERGFEMYNRDVHIRGSNKEELRTAYSKRYNKPKPHGVTFKPTPKGPYLLEEIYFANYMDARRVISHMRAKINRYEHVTVGDLYSLVGMHGTFTDERYGWTDLSFCTVSNIKDEWSIDFPKPDRL